MTQTEAIRLALDLGAKGYNATAVGIKLEGKGYSFITWSVDFPEKGEKKSKWETTRLAKIAGVSHVGTA